MKLEIMDTTLRDGEQTSGVSFTYSEKLTMAKQLLRDLKVDRLEIASARVSEGEYQGARKIFDWANANGFGEKIEILGFVDHGVSLNWIKDAGGQVINLLCKGSLKHCEKQLRKTKEEHLTDIQANVKLASELGIAVNIYLEDWSNGMRESRDYVHFMVEGLKDTDVKRILLPDTLGVQNHEEAYEACQYMVSNFPGVTFDYHAHNDYDLGAANVYGAIKAGIRGIHTTLNGLGERAGNVSLSSVIAIGKDHLGVELNIDESKLYQVSKTVESFSGIRIPHNKPIIGEHVFTQTAGIHADGDNKDKLYQTKLHPERFGRNYTYALGKLSGKANIVKNLEELGYAESLSNEEIKKVTQKVIDLGDKKETVTKEDLPFIISDVLKSETIQEKVKVLNYALSVAHGLKSVASLKIAIEGNTYEHTASGDGQYDAFMNALRFIYKKELDKSFPLLKDYVVSIPPGGKTNALVVTSITWENPENGNTLKTRGLDSDQTVAAIQATIKMLNITES